MGTQAAGLTVPERGKHLTLPMTWCWVPKMGPQEILVEFSGSSEFTHGTD